MSKKSKAILIIVAGLVLVAVGVFASYLLIQRFSADQAPVVIEDVTVKTSVVILTHDLSLGDRIKLGDIQLASAPVEIIPRTAITDIEEAVGKIIKTDLVQGEMLLSHNLADPTNKNQDLSFILSEDHVLMAFPANDLMSRESMVQRGDIVDIFASFTVEVKTVGETTTGGGELEQPQMRIFTQDTLQKVGVTALVLDIIGAGTTTATPFLGETTQEEVNEPEPERLIRAYLLALDPQDALILKHLKDSNAIFDIVLRAPTSTVQFELTPVTEEYLIEFYGLEILP